MSLYHGEVMLASQTYVASLLSGAGEKQSPLHTSSFPQMLSPQLQAHPSLHFQSACVSSLLYGHQLFILMHVLLPFAAAQQQQSFAATPNLSSFKYWKGKSNEDVASGEPSFFKRLQTVLRDTRIDCRSANVNFLPIDTARVRFNATFLSMSGLFSDPSAQSRAGGQAREVREDMDLEA
eukprot:CAMPEP_0177673214 /NCGR_PEP_ID=MMETSP0447-20121125/25811_1 /TAXON_ID=0 /ORGANISM="Stygamoeba regulata, Strain BSH-02190019" /LENGTH=178 /DNA_ID=CAMNT_0019181045 /DNA_START=12 /DNA_END=544 /DNA_ORIENTATION=+